MRGQNKFDLKTLAVHTGVYKDLAFNSVTTPIYPSSTFRFDEVGKNRGYDYTRTANPTRSALEENIAALEGGVQGFATCTGMSAEITTLFLLSSGDHIITGHDIYGGTYRLFESVLPRLGLSFSFVDMRDPENVCQAIRKETKALWVETPSNPLLNLVDLEAMEKIAKENKLLNIVDNTFLSPYFQRPFEYGANIIVHSTTKYLNGHSDVVGGIIISATKELGERIAFLGNALGTGCSPFDAWLVLRGVKTLPYRMEAHQKGAQAVAEFLEGHPNVERVYYPGLKSHPQHKLALKQMKGFGGMLSFDLRVNKVSPGKFFKNLKLFSLAESLGGVESLIEQPWTMSHASMSESSRKTAGISPGTIRVSIGIEDPDDLISDIGQALKKGEL